MSDMEAVRLQAIARRLYAAAHQITLFEAEVKFVHLPHPEQDMWLLAAQECQQIAAETVAA